MKKPMPRAVVNMPKMPPSGSADATANLGLIEALKTLQTEAPMQTQGRSAPSPTPSRS